MPDDSIFGSPPPTPPPHALREGPPAGPSAEDLTRQLATGIQQAIAPLAEQVRNLEERLATPPKPSSSAPAPTAGEGFLERFVAKPEDALREQIDQTVSPILGPALQVLHEAEQSKQRDRVVARFGEKAWDEVVAPRLQSMEQQLQRENPRALANPGVKRHLVSTILGSDDVADSLEAHRQETARMAADAARNRQRPPSFLGTPGRVGYQSEEDPLSQADLDILAKIKTVDPRFDLKAARSAQRQYATVEDRYEAEMKAQRAAGGR